MYSIKKSNRQTISHKDYFSMTLYDHSNSLDYTITCYFGGNKQDKLYSNHQFTLHIPPQRNHHSGEFRYEASKLYIINFQWLLRMQLIGVGAREPTKHLSMINLPWQGFELFFTKIEAHSDMV